MPEGDPSLSSHKNYPEEEDRQLEPNLNGIGEEKKGDQIGDGNQTEEKQEEEEDGEETECGFCLFMKGGGCKDAFIAWEKCVEEAEKNKEDIVEKCFEVTGLLTKCMTAHADYYEPILRAEKAMVEEAARELEKKPDSDPATEAAAVQELQDTGKEASSSNASSSEQK